MVSDDEPETTTQKEAASSAPSISKVHEAEFRLGGHGTERLGTAPGGG
jgi:hypothetical protein